MVPRFRTDWVTELDRRDAPLALTTGTNKKWSGERGTMMVRRKKNGLSHIVQHKVGDIHQHRTFLSHVLFEVREQRRIFSQLLQGEHVIRADEPAVLVRLVSEPCPSR